MISYINFMDVNLFEIKFDFSFNDCNIFFKKYLYNSFYRKFLKLKPNLYFLLYFIVSIWNIKKIIWKHSLYLFKNNNL